jgi:proteic killer suppression protein
MIRSLADDETERVWKGERSRKLPPDIQNTARRKLRQLDAAERLDEMAVPRGNRLEQLKDSDPPRYSIRINDQWRITFHWLDGATEDVRIEDYHKG